VRAWAVTLSLLTGCDYVLGLEQVPAVPLPPDAAMYCHAFPADAAMGTDPDLDNKPSQEDNCPDVANTDQADEDNDCRGNRCDLCPWDPVPNPDMPDGDGDKIGDDCDPFVSQNTLDFLSFSDPNDFPGSFHSGNASWVVEASALTHTPQAGIASAFYGGAVTAGFVAIGVRVPAETRAQAADFMVGAWLLGYDNGGTYNGVRVGVFREDGRYWFRIENVLPGSGPTTIGQFEVMGSQLPDQLRIRAAYSNTAVSARLELPDDDAYAMATLGGTGNGYSGLVTVDTIASFDYFVWIH